MIEPSEFQGIVQGLDDSDENVESNEQLDNIRSCVLEYEKKYQIICDEVKSMLSGAIGAIDKWNDVGLGNLCTSMDDQVLRYTSLKEDYVARRKALTTKVRIFSKRYLQEKDEQSNEIDAGELITNCKMIVETFKAEFDQLANLSKFAETAFFSAYKAIRDIPDPLITIRENYNFAIQMHEFILESNKIINMTYEYLTMKSDSLHDSNNNQASANNNSLSAEMNIDEMVRSRLQSDTITLKSQFESELRNREQYIKNLYEQKQLELQQSYDECIAQKDSHIASLMSTLNDYSQRNTNIQQNESILQLEVNKRYILEEKLQVAMKEVSALSSINQQLQVNMDALTARSQQLEYQNSKIQNELNDALVSTQRDTHIYKIKINMLEAELQSRPPIDLSRLAFIIGMDSDNCYNHSVQRKNSWDDDVEVEVEEADYDHPDISSTQNHRRRTWEETEKFIIDQIRNANAQASQCRVENTQLNTQMQSTVHELQTLQKVVTDKTNVIESLERDLVSAHEAIEAGKALIKCLQSQRKDVVLSQDSIHHMDRLTQDHGIRSHMDTSSLAGASFSAEHLDHQSESTYDPRKQPHPHLMNNNDIEACHRNNDINNDISQETSLTINRQEPGDRMLQAVQAQRDRYMRLTREKEKEISALQSALHQSKEEIQQLRNDNMELYKRFRILRASVGSKTITNHPSEYSNKYPHHWRNEKKFDYEKDDIKGNDELMSKYQLEYENQLNPFLLEELDKKVILSKMNILERMLAIVTKFMFQDQWSRHALLLYLFIVHMLAVGYTMKLMNPELDNESSSVKTAWNNAFFESAEEHPDLIS